MTIVELVLALKHTAEASPLGLETPVFCDGKASDEVLAISAVEIDDEGDCMTTLV